jgi:hypothetical protein
MERLAIPLTKSGKIALLGGLNPALSEVLPMQVSLPEIVNTEIITITDDQLARLRKFATESRAPITEYLAHALHFVGSNKSISLGEQWWQKELHKEIGGSREVATPAGFIDILTPTHLIEVKYSVGWKAAIGQVISYGHYHPDRIKTVALIGAIPKPCTEVCKPLGIEVWSLSQSQSILCVTKE